jgi:cytochrome c
MKPKYALSISAVLIASAPLGQALAADGNPQRGAMVYRACVACHSLEPHLNLTGPSLAGVWEKKAGSVAGFPRYSKALKQRHFVWDETTLFAWLANPQEFVPGTYMTFRGLRDEKQRSDLIAFLKIAMGPDGARPVVAQKLIPAEEARGQTPEPLDNVGPEERVTAIRHCHNTFVVSTADGKERSFWELNLRLKVDSSSTGPKEGKAAMLPAGMQGDRASVVFSSPTEIGRWIEEKCEG